MGGTLMTPGQVAEFLNVKHARIYDFVARGELKARRVGRQLRFRPEDVEQFLERNTVRA